MFKQMSSLITGTLTIVTCLLQISAYNNSRSNNLAVYWGQNSYGATHTSDSANWQKSLSAYCQDDVINAIPLAFLNVFFSAGGVPEINFSNICSSSTNEVFPGTNLANCQFMAADIQACQAKGKIVTISLGGASGAATFSSDAHGQAFAQTIWNLFLGGSSSTRPFGSAILDGVDLDIEGGGNTGFAAFVNQLRMFMATGNKPYYVTAAPQCPFPDAYIGAALNVAQFDAVYVQFYNNYCGNNNPLSWDFEAWDNWARTQSPNPNVKVYIGAPASSTAAGSGYVDVTTLGNLALSARAQYPSFGGIMLWDVSQAYANGRYDAAVKNAMGSRSGSTIPLVTAKTSTTTSITPTTTPAMTSTMATLTSSTTSTAMPRCASVSVWSPSIAYSGNSRVMYNEHLWTNSYWSYNDVPGGTAGVWIDKGPCLAGADVKPPTTTSHGSSHKTTGSSATTNTINSRRLDSRGFKGSFNEW